MSTFLNLMAIFVLVSASVAWVKYKRKVQELDGFMIENIGRSSELKKTLAMGLYRFKSEKPLDQNENERKISEVFIKEDPISFEHFVADIFSKVYGGKTEVTAASGDFGVDIEDEREDGTYLVQVKCYKSDLGFEPIALIHSNMVKRGVEGGYVVTTGGFNGNALIYAKGLGIELIDGIKLVNLWLDSMEKGNKILRNMNNNIEINS